MTKQEQIKQYFHYEKVKQCISIKKVAELAGMHYSVLHHFLKGYPSRNLSDAQAESILNVLKDISFK